MKPKYLTPRIRSSVFERSLKDEDLRIITLPCNPPKQISILRACVPFTVLLTTLKVIQTSIEQHDDSPTDKIALTTLIKHCLEDFYITPGNKCVIGYLVTSTTFCTPEDKLRHNLVFRANGELNIYKSTMSGSKTTTNLSVDEGEKICEQLTSDLKQHGMSLNQDSTEGDCVSMIDDENHVILSAEQIFEIRSLRASLRRLLRSLDSTATVKTNTHIVH